MPPVWTIFLYGYFQSQFYDTGDSSNLFWPVIIFFSILVGSFYIFNQLNDVESDRVNNKLFILSQNIISVKSAKITSFTMYSSAMIFSFVLSIYTNSISFFVVFCLATVSGIGYNLPPFLLKNRPIAGLILNSLGHGMFTYLAGWVAFSYTLSLTAVLWSLALTFGNAAIYLLTTVVDFEGDKKMDKKTFVVMFGREKTLFSAFVLIFLSVVTSLIPCLYIGFEPLAILPLFVSSLATLLFFVPLLNFKASFCNKKVFRAFKWGVFFVTASVFVFYPLYAAVVGAVFFFTKYYYKKRFNKNYPTFKPE